MLNDIYINVDVQETKAFLNNVLFLIYILYCLMQKSIHTLLSLVCISIQSCSAIIGLSEM